MGFFSVLNRAVVVVVVLVSFLLLMLSLSLFSEAILTHASSHHARYSFSFAAGWILSFVCAYHP
ncbi:hypothetical protein B0T13DRAFT_66666 [Neurospora crassa]|nr:hypothetical protein B0T13DRAFT_66666 [Neurospora crassa]